MTKFTVLLLVTVVFTCALSPTAARSIYFLSPVRDTLPVAAVNQLVVDDKIFEKVETEASFEGGEKAWISFLQTNLRAEIPAKKKAPVGLYQVFIQFVVDKEGKISDIKALT
ncbi:MAG: hypothetical protein M3352_11480, partial [Bacteroidota bacterium]|nr:hypothetical protein [Bacteroidota bacterium]